MESMPIVRNVIFSVIACLVMGYGMVVQAAPPKIVQGGMQTISIHDLDPEEGSIRLTDQWKFATGDNPLRAGKLYDDSAWELVSTLLGKVELDFIEWEATAWFRLKLHVDESLIGMPMAFDLPLNNGNTEIFINGEKQFEFGNNSGEGLFNTFDLNRKPALFTFQEPGEHIIAIRFSNEHANRFVQKGHYAGFRLQLFDANRHVNAFVGFLRTSSFYQYLFTGALLVFTIIHLLLFLFYPTQKENLFFAMFTLTLAMINFLQWQAEFAVSGLMFIQYEAILTILKAVAILFFIRFTYSMYYKRIPIGLWLFTVPVVGDTVYRLWTSEAIVTWFLDLLLVIFCIEVIRLSILAYMRKREGILIFGTGILFFIITQVLLIFSGYDFIPVNPQWIGVAGTAVLLLSMSVSLSHNVAMTTQELKKRLIEVKMLSEKSLEQERVNREFEVEKRLLEIDNDRKTKELDEARKLQLSMLPDRVPRIEDLEISVKMTTASEVGGDYYDFFKCNDGSLIIALGDATGHGLKAGMALATVRSYFHTLANEGDLLQILDKISVGIRNMNIKMLYMGLMLIRLKGNDMEVASAGMPPLLHYNAETGRLSEYRIKGLPLGSKARYPYQVHRYLFGKGDMLLAMSDGLFEAFNKEREMFGMDRTKEVLLGLKDEEADDVIRRLFDAFRKWTGQNTPEDDITLLILRNKAQEISLAAG